MSLEECWHGLMRHWQVPPALAATLFDEVCDHYEEPGRYYHTLAHVQSVLAVVELLGELAVNLPAVRLAAWLHDVIYDSRACDNEEQSAGFAVAWCNVCGIDAGPWVADLIRRTKSHEAGDDPDAQVLLDADLAILGADEANYRRYCEQIRMEYAWVADADYRVGRKRVLQGFLDRPRIFYVLPLEESARRNLRNEIAELSV